MTKLHLVKTQMHTPKFTVLTDSYRFGADEKLTVVTAYLMPNIDLHRLAISQISCLKNELAVAFIISHDYEDNSLELHCITEHHTQHTLSLPHHIKESLSAAFTQTTLNVYGYTPKDILNIFRGYADMAPI